MAITFKVQVDRIQTTERPDGVSEVEAFITVEGPRGERLGASIILSDPEELALVRPGVWFKLGLIPDTEPPSAPPYLTARADGSTVLLAWGPSTDDVHVMAYQITRGGKPLATTQATSFAVSDLKPGDYDFAVAAIDSAGTVGPTSEVAVTVEKPAPAPAPA